MHLSPAVLGESYAFDTVAQPPDMFSHDMFWLELMYFEHVWQTAVKQMYLGLKRCQSRHLLYVHKQLVSSYIGLI